MISASTKELLKRYRKIIIAVGLFLLFDLGVMGTNFYSSYKISESAVSINLSGRQRMLSQRTTKVLLSLQEDLRSKSSPDADLAELKQVVQLFDTTLKGFRDGGIVTGGDNKPVELAKVETEESERTVQEAYAIWTPYLEKLRPLIADRPFMDEELSAAVGYARDNNLKLLKLMNDLTTDLEHVANARAWRLRMIQIVGLLAALLNFGYTVAISMRDLVAGDRAVAQARKETDEILATVREGLFLLDAQYRIGSQYSESLPDVIQRDVYPGTLFLPILQEMVPAKVYESAKDYIELLFGERVKEALITGLNPLSEVAVNLPDKSSSVETGNSVRYLSFHFNRVIAGGKISHLLVTVQDVTEQVNLSKQLELAKGQARIEVEALLHLLNTDATALQQFLHNIDTGLEQINERLRTNDDSQQGRLHTVNYILRIVHGIKGEAATLGVEMFETYAHDCEKEMVRIRDRDEVNGDDMIRITVMLEGFYDRLSSLTGIVRRLSSVHIPEEGEGSLIARFTDNLDMLAQRIANDQGKQVKVTAAINDLNQLPRRIIRELQGISVQLVRNAITHGIEVPEKRLQSQKPAVGSLHIECKDLGNDQFTFTLRDDGHGIIPQQLRETLINSGRMTREEVDKLSNVEVAQKIFEPGFSTAGQADRDAGHGVGLDVVLEKIRALRGRLLISTRANNFTEFRIKFET